MTDAAYVTPKNYYAIINRMLKEENQCLKNKEVVITREEIAIFGSDGNLPSVSNKDAPSRPLKPNAIVIHPNKALA